MQIEPGAVPESLIAFRALRWQRLRALLSHQASVNAIAVVVLLWSIWMATRIALAALSWGELDTDPYALLSVFGRGAATDALLALAAGSFVLAFGALTHLAPRSARWKRAGRGLRLAIIAAAAGFIAIAEVLFWDEFSTRFNFIAVDYLIYTNEVIGNIRESYPLPALLAALAPFGAASAWMLARLRPLQVQPAWPFAVRAGVAFAAMTVCVVASTAAMKLDDATATAPGLRDQARNQELARNGQASFVMAFRDNELPFRRFYATLDASRVARLAGPWPRAEVASGIVPAVAKSFAKTSAKTSAKSSSLPTASTLPRHVVIIQVESLSADFLGVFGNREDLTPQLDRIAQEGVLFTNLYAIGTRTVRGLEALSAGLPPLPGQSLVRRPGNEKLQTLGALLRGHGFETTFLYGGYGYFDNMNAYFAGNGYRVRDRSDIPDERIGFSNVWGISDEYLFDDALAEMERASAGGRPQLLHLMTTSNHRPYTYPDGRIDIASKTGRRGAVQYTDWAIGRFIDAARSRPWFDDTLFVIVADHCASVAGKTRIPPQRYHIPAIFYSPKHLIAGTVTTLASQIDLAPTIAASLGIDDRGRFFGQNLFGARNVERAFLGNYQEIGMLTPGAHGDRDLIVLSPRKRIAQYRIGADGHERAVPVDSAKAEQTIAEYQLADDLVQSGRYREEPALAPRTRQGIASPGFLHAAALGGAQAARVAH